MRYSKPAFTIPDQIKKLEKRGMVFKDKTIAEEFLCFNSYYRFSGYTYIFQDRSKPAHLFKPSVDFEEVFNLYSFDNELRLLLLTEIRKIEIAFRTVIMNEYAQNYNSHWHLDFELFKDYPHHIMFLNKLINSIDPKREDFLKHYQKKYTSPQIPASWMCFEIMSMGQLSSLYKNLNDTKKGKIDIAKTFGLNKSILFSSWIHGISIVRNICAHHGRLWNKSIPVNFINLNEMKNQFIMIIPANQNKIYVPICCIQYLLNIIEPQNDFKIKLKNLLLKYPSIDLDAMGFPNGWDKEMFWQ
ncbi:hypothetical protein MmiHf6_13050 [Methanimicrococcus hongohii]|uniref:Abortive infection bacteriophage resistance protein n=2 Tax=Methanimicrococcus hongohii TaxID=3028295 RepID=A0AA96V169_9EURY|nr:hypothetical protein MmiHf6_13050 [Methanimicrococcus sp. Hf6]